MRFQFKLVDGEEQHKRYPKTYWIPSKKDRETVKVGQEVKLGFYSMHDPKERTERMWVMVTKAEDGVYWGYVDNQPAFLTCVKYKSKVKFEAKHIINILTPELKKYMDSQASQMEEQLKCLERSYAASGAPSQKARKKI